MNREAYDKIDALNWSKAKLLLRSPYHFHNAPFEVEDTDAMQVGRLTHAMVLEGKGIDGVFAVKPKGMSFATREGKAWRDAQRLPILSYDDKARILGMAEALAGNKDAEKMIRSCPLREHAVTTTMNGVKCKGLIDAMGNDQDRRPGFLEIKTSMDAREEFWQKRCCGEPFHYDGQTEWYSSLLSLTLDMEGTRPWSVWLVVESKPPHAVACWAPDETMIASGTEKVRDVLTSWKACQASHEWPGYHKGIKLISAPRWRLNQLSSL